MNRLRARSTRTDTHCPYTTLFRSAVPVDVRVIAAGNRDLAALCNSGQFRSDLYWRLNVMPLHLKPLVERRQDIRAIAPALLLRQQANEAAFVWPTAKAMEMLMAHRWPGDARELGNVLPRALVLRHGERIGRAPV